ncbi:MAG: potassium-transporting ATPase subunit KdpC [Proteobacteria bacterium]|nr:potassium-transporting ATPase subunit KdpC [Pseudomonadota bacterium]
MWVRMLRPSISFLGVMTVLLGLCYPAAMAALAMGLFPHAAHGSLVFRDGHAIGSSLIGQSFTGAGYFWGRPSATSPQPFNGMASGGSNLGPLNPALADAVRANVRALRDADPGEHRPVPVELATASASGLDPDLSVAGVAYQVPRVARARGLSQEALQAIVDAHTRSRLFGFVGERTVNVLEINLALDSMSRVR